VRRAARYAASLALPEAAWGTGTVTLGAERAVIAHDLGPAAPEGADLRRRSGTGGVLAQAALAVRGGLHLTTGLRLERHDDFGPRHGAEALPMAGAALVRAVGPAQVIARVSYGRGIRAPAPTAAQAVRTTAGIQRANPRLGPESQEGVEAGVEVQVGGRASLQVTRYDQVAEGLVQPVPVAGAAAPGAGGLTTYQQQNVGVIANHGWELQGALRAGPVGLRAALAITDSRVRRVAPGYDGDLRAGDRPLGVARHAASLTAAVPLGPARLALGATRVGPLVAYDRRALRAAGALTPGGTRAFWVEHDAATEYGASVGLPIGPGRRLLVKMDDVFDRRAPERDTLGAGPGRTTVAALQFGF
jgi:outer membrane receptor protein involved in Fe transport